jgi:UDP-glucuronate 4-epimerase
LYNLATGRAISAADWCRALTARRPNFRWRLAADGEACNVESHTGFDRGAMRIERITADTPYRPAFDLEAAADHLLAWRSR